MYCFWGPRATELRTENTWISQCERLLGLCSNGALNTPNLSLYFVLLNQDFHAQSIKCNTKKLRIFGQIHTLGVLHRHSERLI